MNLAHNVPAARSILWSRVARIFVLAGLVLMGVYIWQFVNTIDYGRNALRFEQFMQFRSAFMIVLVIYLALLLFVLGLWAYALFVDLNNIFRPFNYYPQEAMLYTMIPVLNFYGVGWVITRIVRVFEHEKLRFTYRDLIRSLKLSLAAFYAGASGVVVSMYFAVTMKLNVQVFYQERFIGFNLVEFVLIAVAASTLIWLIYRTQKIITTGLKEEFEHG